MFTILKLLLYASYVEPENFNSYAIALSLGSFLAYIISFGLVESTTKTFSRLYVAKQIHSILGSFRYIAPKFLTRGVFLLFGLIIYILISANNSFVWVIGLCLLAITVSMSTLLASMQRSTMKTNLMAGTSLLRAVLSMFAIFVGYIFSPIYGAIYAEIFAQIFSLIFGFYLLLKSHSVKYSDIAQYSIELIKVDLQSTKSVKFYLFFAYLIMSVPLYLDRFYFEMNYSISEMAPYSLCAILLSASYLMYNSLFQKVGPEMIMKAKKGGTSSKILLVGARAVILGAFCLLLLFLIIFVAYNNGLAAYLVNKYNVTAEIIFLIFLISLSNATVIFEGAFLSFDKEKAFFSNSALYLFFLSLLILVNFIFELSLVEFLYCYLVVKVLHVISTLITFWISTKNQNTSQLAT